MYTHTHTHTYICTHTHTYMYIYLHAHHIYIYKSYTKTAAKEAILLLVKSSSDDDPGFRHGFGAEASSPLTQGVPAVSHNTTRLYWMVFNLNVCHIRSDAVTALFWIVFIYSLFIFTQTLYILYTYTHYMYIYILTCLNKAELLTTFLTITEMI